MNVPIFYAYLQFKIAEHCKNRSYVSIEEVHNLLGYYRISRKIKPIVLQEMQYMNLIKLHKDTVIPLKLKPSQVIKGNRLTTRTKFIESLLRNKFFEY